MCAWADVARFDSTKILDLVGSYRLTLIADSFPSPGATSTGTLEIRLEDLALAASVDPTSTDPENPGVYYDDRWEKLRVGDRPFTLDGTSTSLFPEALSSRGFHVGS